jgi:hypothetical protein
MKITGFSEIKLKSKELSAEKKEQKGKSSEIVKSDVDRYVESNTEKINQYKLLKTNIDEKMLKNVMNQTEKARGLIKNLVSDMLKRQLGISKDSDISIDELMKKFQKKVEISGEENFTIDEIAQKEAQKLIEPGGEWSPDKVSDRIVDFSIAVFGGDKSKIEIIREAINRGFGEAEKEWGSELPDITNETKSLIDEKLENWVNEDLKEENSEEEKKPLN